MALSGVNQSYVQPVWAEIPPRSADIGAVPRLFAASPINNVAGALGNLSALPAQNLLAQPSNFWRPNQYLLTAIDVNVPGVSITIDRHLNHISVALRPRFY